MNSRARNDGPLMTVWAHPDDEAYLAAATMIDAACRGREVVIVTATRGELGIPPGSAIEPARMAEIRTAEMQRAVAALGASEHVFLDLPDGGCDGLDDFGQTQRLARLIERVVPSTVLTFGPDGITGHPDHCAVSRWTTAAVTASAPTAELLYATMLPGWDAHFLDEALIDDIYGAAGPPSTEPGDLAALCRADGVLLDAKMAVLEAHESQTAGLITALGRGTYTSWVAAEAFRRPSAAEVSAASTRTAA